jgi:hypothetical protein
MSPFFSGGIHLFFHLNNGDTIQLKLIFKKCKEGATWNIMTKVKLSKTERTKTITTSASELIALKIIIKEN